MGKILYKFFIHIFNSTFLTAEYQRDEYCNIELPLNMVYSIYHHLLCILSSYSRSFGVHWAVYHTQCIIRQQNTWNTFYSSMYLLYDKVKVTNVAKFIIIIIHKAFFRH